MTWLLDGNVLVALPIAMLASVDGVDKFLGMTLDQLKAEVLAASPEVREELFTLLGVLRRARDPNRARVLAEKMDDPHRWVPEEEAARRLGLDFDEAK
jgi:hypothetical protein